MNKMQTSEDIEKDGNALLAEIHKERKGHYCHALEVETAYELECIVESLIEQCPGYSELTYIDFFSTMELYSLNDENENEIYNFSFSDYIRDTI